MFLIQVIKIISILISAYLVNRFLKFFIEKTIRAQIQDKIREEKRKRIETLLSVIGGTTKFIIWIVALLMILSELDVNIVPILAGLGIAGLTVGMAARDIISDLISGFFILLEDQYRVGDKIKITDFEGEVKELTLRRTIIKDGNGFLHSIPNSQIKIVSKKIDQDE